MNNKKILIIQTAFIGDVILATSFIEFCAKNYPTVHIDFLLRNGNESIIDTNPNISKLWIWNKNKNKYRNLLSLLFKVRKEKYDYVFNIQRFFNSGFLTIFSGAKVKVGFNKNPLSALFTHKIVHKIPHKINGSYYHEVERNLQLLAPVITDLSIPSMSDLKTKIYFNQNDKDTISKLSLDKNYLVMAPSSVWFTKQWPFEKWKELIAIASPSFQIVLIGAPSDKEYLEPLSNNSNTLNLAGELSLRQSALLMKNAARVFVNDSAPLHLASSVNAKTTAIFCSTIPEFGYGPLSDDQKIIQTSPKLPCMPCGLHGHNSCPKAHFNCATNISAEAVFNTTSQRK
jgi:heptosyltransferase-2